MSREKILEVKDLTVSFNTYAGKVQAVRGNTFDLYKGEVLAEARKPKSQEGGRK